MSSTTPQQYPANPYSPQSTLGPPNKPTGAPAAGGGGWKWLFIILGIGGVGFLVCCGACVGLGFWGMGQVTKMPPYTTAIAKVRESPEVNDKLGNPIEDSIIWNGFQIQDRGQTGTARFTINLKGPKGAGTAKVSATKQGGTWVLDDCTVTFPDGTTQQLADAPTAEATAPDAEESGEMKEEKPEGEPAESTAPAP